MTRYRAISSAVGLGFNSGDNLAHDFHVNSAQFGDSLIDHFGGSGFVELRRQVSFD